MLEAKAENILISIAPHRSLGRHGLRFVLGALAFGNLVTLAFFWSAKMWPIFGFMGLDLLAVYAAFRINNHRANRQQVISIEGDAVTLTNSSPGKSRSQQFNRRWLQVILEEDIARELVGRMFFVSHGKRHEIGAFLGADEKRELASRLRQAMLVRRV